MVSKSFVLFSSLILGTFVSTSFADEDNCPDTGIDYLPNYGNCSKFFKCDEGNRIPMQCPEGFAWSATDTACELEENVDCSYLTTPSPITTTPANECPETGTSYLPNYYDCTKFFKCEEGEKIDMECPEGFAWDDERKSCDLLENVDCKYVTVSPTENPTITTNGYTSDPSCSSGISFIPHPYDCSLYYECINGRKVLMPCAEGYLFSIETNTCELTNTVDCSYTSPGGPTDATTKPFTGTTETSPTSAPAPIDDLCKDQSDGTFVAYPSDCTMFVQCRSNEGILYQCQSGSSWNQNQQVCDTNNVENCSGRTSATRTSSGTTPSNKPTRPSDVTTGSTTRGYTADPSCPEDGTAYLPHPTNCSLYYECINGRKVLMPCADGYLFNTEINGCDIAANVDCNHVLCVGQADETFLIHPTDCAKFIQCKSEEAILHQCATGSGWNESSKKCDSNITC